MCNRWRAHSLPSLEDLLAPRVERVALVVHDLVVFEQVLADLEVALLDLPLGAFDALGDALVLDGGLPLQPQPAQNP